MNRAIRTVTDRSRHLLLVGAALAVGALTWNAPSSAVAQSDADARCRAAMSARIDQYVDVVLRETDGCHALRMRGLLPQSLVCEDHNAWEGAGFQPGALRVQRAYDRLAREIGADCAGASAPPILGFTGCPPPCAGPVASYAQVGTCLACLADAELTRLVQRVYGTPPLVRVAGKPALVCQKRIGRAVQSLLTGRLSLQRTCQTQKDRGKAEVGSVDCRNVDDPQHPFNAAFGRLLANAESHIARCATTDAVDVGATLDSCGTDVPTEQACVKGLVAATADALFFHVYAPPGPPTPTPTPTRTPTCAPTGTPPPFPSCGPADVVVCNNPALMCQTGCLPCPSDCSKTCSPCRCCHCGTPTPSPTQQPVPVVCTGSPCPDLRPGSVVLARGPGCIAPLTYYWPQATVCVGNGGDGDAGPFHVRYGTTGGPGETEYLVSGLAAHGRDCRNLGYAYGSQHRIAVDVRDEVVESNELDNVGDFSVAIPSYPPTCTYGLTPSPTPTSCGVTAPTIEPVDSPTALEEQVIVAVGRITGARTISFSSPAGCTQPTPVMAGSRSSALCRLLPRQANRIDVCIHDPCPGPSACSSVWIVHADPTPTPPQTPAMPTPTPT